MEMKLQIHAKFRKKTGARGVRVRGLLGCFTTRMRSMRFNLERVNSRGRRTVIVDYRSKAGYVGAKGVESKVSTTD